ncbi:MAG: chorismate mutase [Spirochaetia bacterium]|jgi:chorismate mutase|nr:chorismate mutase [Spirochaetia bacterium]
MAIKAVRGAIQIDNNSVKAIEIGVVRLIQKISAVNNIFIENIISIIFSQTKDLDALNPAAALRTIGYEATPLFCTTEPDIIGSMNRIIRVLITVDTMQSLKPVYLEGAKKLRLDLVIDGK